MEIGHGGVDGAEIGAEVAELSVELVESDKKGRAVGGDIAVQNII